MFVGGACDGMAPWLKKIKGRVCVYKRRQRIPVRVVCAGNDAYDDEGASDGGMCVASSGGRREGGRLWWWVIGSWFTVVVPVLDGYGL